MDQYAKNEADRTERAHAGPRASGAWWTWPGIPFICYDCATVQRLVGGKVRRGRGTRERCLSCGSAALDPVRPETRNVAREMIRALGRGDQETAGALVEKVVGMLVGQTRVGAEVVAQLDSLKESEEK